MTTATPVPGTGIDRHTGRVLSGWDHLQQSLEVIFTTKFGDRFMRRWFGSFVPGLLGRPLVPSTILKFQTALAVAIDQWEPRYKVTRVIPSGTEDGIRAGKLSGLSIEGIYRPRGHLGDFTPEPGPATRRRNVNLVAPAVAQTTPPLTGTGFAVTGA